MGFRHGRATDEHPGDGVLFLLPARHSITGRERSRERSTPRHPDPLPAAPAAAPRGQHFVGVKGKTAFGCGAWQT